ncbi:hypothetical protein SAMN05216436_106143 [bacterium A37T11]|nr:hypothetical protein SAMN05216436_106143 [bacterium A37T11]
MASAPSWGVQGKGDTFTNSSVKSYFSEELKQYFKGKSIEWNKSVLEPYILDTEETQKGKTKPEKVYKLEKKIPAGFVKKAIETVGDDWLEAGKE